MKEAVDTEVYLVLDTENYSSPGLGTNESGSGRVCTGCSQPMPPQGDPRIRNGVLMCAVCDPSDRSRRRTRRDLGLPGRSISIPQRSGRDTLAQLRAAGVETPAGVERPRTWGECRGKTGPCPFVGCAANLYLDVSPITGSIKLNFPDLEPDQLADPCVLRIAERGMQTLEETGAHMNLTRERTRQIAISGIAKLRGKRSLR